MFRSAERGLGRGHTGRYCTAENTFVLSPDWLSKGRVVISRLHSLGVLREDMA